MLIILSFCDAKRTSDGCHQTDVISHVAVLVLRYTMCDRASSSSSSSNRVHSAAQAWEYHEHVRSNMKDNGKFATFVESVAPI